jgi:hypothetical protein
MQRYGSTATAARPLNNFPGADAGAFATGWERTAPVSPDINFSFRSSMPAVGATPSSASKRAANSVIFANAAVRSPESTSALIMPTAKPGSCELQKITTCGTWVSPGAKRTPAFSPNTWKTAGNSEKGNEFIARMRDLVIQSDQAYKVGGSPGFQQNFVQN